MKQKSWLRRHPRGAVLVTGILALIISALPLAALHIADMPLFNRSHKRSWQAGNDIQVSNNDFYLLKALQEQNRLQEEGLYWQSEEFFMEYPEGEALMLDYLNDLVQAGVLKEEWVDSDILLHYLSYMDSTGGQLVFSYRGNAAGFIDLQVQERYGPEQVIQYIRGEVFLESKTGKITHFMLSMPQYEIDLNEVLNNYVEYLGLSGLDDWREVPNPTYRNTLYSLKAQAMVSTDLYTSDSMGIQVLYCTLSVFDAGDENWLEQEMDWYTEPEEGQ